MQARAPAALANAARQAIHAIDPGRPVYAVRPLGEAIQGALSQERFRAVIVSLFSVLALTLAAIGLYGVMAYMVSQRTREIGIRIAIGARPLEIVESILRSASVLAGVGGIAGMAIAALGSRMFSALLYGVGSFDPATYFSAIGVFFAVALLATIIPELKAHSQERTRAGFRS